MTYYLHHCDEIVLGSIRSSIRDGVRWLVKQDLERLIRELARGKSCRNVSIEQLLSAAPQSARRARECTRVSLRGGDDTLRVNTQNFFVSQTAVSTLVSMMIADPHLAQSVLDNLSMKPRLAASDMAVLNFVREALPASSVSLERGGHAYPAVTFRAIYFHFAERNPQWRVSLERVTAMRLLALDDCLGLVWDERVRVSMAAKPVKSFNLSLGGLASQLSIAPSRVASLEKKGVFCRTAAGNFDLTTSIAAYVAYKAGLAAAKARKAAARVHSSSTIGQSLLTTTTCEREVTN